MSYHKYHEIYAIKGDLYFVMPSKKSNNQKNFQNSNDPSPAEEQQLASQIMHSKVWRRQDVAEYLHCGLEYVTYLMEEEGLPFFHPENDDDRRLTLFNEYSVKLWFYRKQKAR